MTLNESLQLSAKFKHILKSDLLHCFQDDFPFELLASSEEQQSGRKAPRERMYTASHTLFSMLLSSVNEDKSLQQSVNIFKTVFESNGQRMQEAEKRLIEQEKMRDAASPAKQGRPKSYGSKIRKSAVKEVSSNTAAYAKARLKLDKNLVQSIFEYSANYKDINRESWYGFSGYIGDGTYLQLQDTDAIKELYNIQKGHENSYPQALLEVFIRQGSGQISQFAIGNRQQSELELVIPMIKKMTANDLLLADDLYNTYYHFTLIKQQKAHIIVPGKRDRNYTVISEIAENDQIVELKKTKRPSYVDKEEWATVPETIQLRRISYNYPTKTGMEECVLFTTLSDAKISAIEIILKYTTRWDIEISIREVKTLMDINVLRSKTPEMLEKELIVSLTAYNMVRKIIAKSAAQSGFPPQEDIFQMCAETNRAVFLDKKGRVYQKTSPGRYGKVNAANKQANYTGT